MAAYPLWSSDWAVVEHGVLLLWRDVWGHLQGPEEDLPSFAHVIANTKVWSTLSSLLGCGCASVELAVVHCLLGVFSSHGEHRALQRQRRLQDQLVATHCIENLCVKLISPYDMEDPMVQQAQELTSLAMVSICKLPHLVDHVCSAGAMDAFTFLVLQEDSSIAVRAHVHRMQDAALQCITFCVQHSMACLEDFDHEDVFVHVLVHYVLSPESPRRRAQVGLSLLAASMRHQPLVCNLLVDHGLVQAIPSMLQSSPSLQLPALDALKHLLKSNHATIPRDTAAHLRASGGLIHLGWLAWTHHSPSVNRAASDVLTCIMQSAQSSGEGPVLAQDLIEQGCVLLLLQRQPSPILTWLLAELDAHDGSGHHDPVSAVVRSNNDLLRTNVIVGMCVASATHRETVDEWWPSIASLLMDSSNKPLLQRVLRVLTALCNPSTVAPTTQASPHGTVPRLPLPTLHGSALTLTWRNKPNDTVSVPKMAMMENSSVVAAMLCADATCTTIHVPHDLPPAASMPLFLQMCQRTSSQPLTHLPNMEWKDLLDLASISQKLGMGALLRTVELALTKQHLPDHVAPILEEAVRMRIPSIVLTCLHVLQSLLLHVEDEKTAAAFAQAAVCGIGMLLAL